MGGIFQNGIWTDGFDYYNTWQQKWSGAVGNTSSMADPSRWLQAPRLVSAGGPSYSVRTNSANPTYLSKNFQEFCSEMFVGFGVKFGVPSAGVGSNYNNFLSFYDSTHGQTYFNLSLNASSMQLAWFQGAGQTNQVGPNSGLYPFQWNVWYYIEVHFIITTLSTGLLEVCINGNDASPIVQYIGVTNFGNTANAVDTVNIGYINRGGDNFFDDFYMIDMSGLAPFNNYLGDVKICTQLPVADSATAGLNAFSTSPTQAAGNHYKNVDEVPPDGDNSYNFDVTAGDRESYRLQPLGLSGPVLCTNVWATLEKDDASSRTFAVTTRNGGVDHIGPTFSSPSSYAAFNNVSVVDPSTGVAWTQAGVNSAEAGVKIIS